MTKRRTFALLTFAALALAVLRWQLARLFAEEPAYEVEGTDDRLEIRRYSARVVAETTVDASWDEGLNEGFGRLAGYIFGGNAGRGKIAMTSPVNAQAAGRELTIAFTMPKGRTPASLPQPDDTRVRLRECSPSRVAVLRFRGRYTAARVASAREELMALVQERGLTPIGEPQFAGYDPPSTLPFLRRNEMWVEVEG